MFCTKCGKQLNDDDRFCPSCGKSTGMLAPDGAGARREQWEGTVFKCPCCGQVLDAFSVVCPSCGFELRDAKATTSLSVLSLKLQEITAHADKGVKQTLLERLRRDTSDVDDRAAALIKAFPIPNTKEDLIEFIIASAANINIDAFNEMKRGNLSSSEIAMSNAWLSKLEQAYRKASIVLDGEASFAKAKEMYVSTMKKVSSARHAIIRFWIALGLVWVGIILFCLLMATVNS
ncbi:zinc ribbon domain-containing protein [Collinsella sp. An307]|uniref:zinc-ribbon domain-containing protein n=1 Tax=Collinsella sp. An307 TaxID=1965630 RepID=UPI0021018699|nr:zinc ribbon domain-containing protein [Collinsella sp. An307]